MANITLFAQVIRLIPREIIQGTFHSLMQFLKNDVFDDFIGCLIV